MIEVAWGAAAAARGRADGVFYTCTGAHETGDGVLREGDAGPGFDLTVHVRPDGLDAERPTYTTPFFVTDGGGSGGLGSTSLRRLVAALPHVRLDADALARFVADETASGELRTIYRGVSRVRGGRRLSVSRAGLREVPSTLPKSPTTPSRGSVVEALAEELRSAVVRGARGDSPLAMPLSGGLDSSGLFATSLELGYDVRPFTIDFAGTPDDRPHVASMERFFGVEVARYAPEVLAPHVATILASYMQPSVMPNACLELGGAALARGLGCATWLTGVGGDDVFGGDLRAFAAEVGPRPVRTIATALGLRVPWSDTARTRLQHWLLEPRLPAVLGRAMARRRFRLHRAKVPFAGPRVRRAFDESLAERMSAPPVGLEPEERVRAYLEQPFLTEAAEVRADVDELVGARRVDPWFDGRLFTFLWRLPLEWLEVDGLHRGLYRRALAGRVPESVRLRTDKGIAEPFVARAFRHAGGAEIFAPYMDFSASADAGLVEPSRLREWLEPHLRSSTFFESAPFWALWRLVGVEALLRRYGT